MQHYRGVSMWSLLCLVSIIPNDVKSTNMPAANPPGECSSNDGVLWCCANHYLANGTCVGSYNYRLECPVGTFRLEKDDLECSKCDKGSYGRFCSYFCDEKCNRRCHPVDGYCCIDNGPMCLTEVERKKIADLVKGLSTIEQKSTVTTSVITHNGTIESDSMVTGEPISKNLLSYGLPGVLLGALIVFIIKWKMTQTIQTRNIQHKNDTIIPLECEYGYAIIDENKLMEQPQNLTKSKKTGDTVHICDETMISRRESPSRDIGSSKEKTNERKTDDYLQPVFENDRLSVGNESDRSDSSIKTDVPVNSDTYLHPYNTLHPDWRSCTHIYNDEETEVKGDGYLNPYQLLQENWLQNTHVYNTAKKTNLSPEKQNDEDVIIEDCSSKQCEKLSLAKGQN